MSCFFFLGEKKYAKEKLQIYHAIQSVKKVLEELDLCFSGEEAKLRRPQEIDKEFFAIISSLKEPSQSYRGFYV